MSRSLIIGIVVTFFIIGGLATFFYINYIKVKSVPAITAVPDDAAFILEVKNIQSVWATFCATDMWKDIEKTDAINQLTEKINLLDSVIALNTNLKEVLADNKTVVSIHTQSGQKLSLLFVAETGNKITVKNISEWVVQQNKFTIRKRSFEKETVYDFLNTDKIPVFSLAYKDDLLICSAEGTLVEEALRKLKYKSSNITKGFEQVAALAELSNDASVYINYQYMASFINLFTKSEYYTLFDYLKRFANWSMFNVKIEKENFSFSGLSYTDDSVFQYLDLFKTQTPLELSLYKNLPKNTAMMLQTSYSDYPKFAADLNEYLQVHKKLDDYVRFTDSLENRYGIDLGDKFISLIGKEAMLGMLEPTNSDFNKELFAVINFTDKTQAETLLNAYGLAIEKRGERDSISAFQYNGFLIDHLQLGNFLKLYYGEIFENIQSPFYTIINNNFVFANDVNALKIIVDNYISGNTLDKDETFINHINHSASTANIDFFFSPNKCITLPSNFVTDEFFSILNRYQYEFKKFEYVSLQFANTNNKAFYTHLNLKFNPSFKENTRMLWAVKLDTTFDIPPVVVFNSLTKQNCILVQDVKNTLYYISNAGNILWRSQLSGKIMSDVKQIDAQKNGKIYYLFNTDKQACLIDETGNNLFGYPVKFPGKATAALSLFDIYNDSTYQFFVPLENNKVIAYTIKGKPLQNWNPKTVDDKIVTPISVIKIAAKPYILAIGLKGSFLMYSLKGERMKTEIEQSILGNIPLYTYSIDSVSAFVSITDTNGVMNIYSIDSSLKFTPNNSYKLSIKPEYLFTNYINKQWFVLAGNKNEFKIFDQPNHQTITQIISDSNFIKPFINTNSSGNLMIGYVNKNANQLNWFNVSGAQYPSFPMEGNSVFGVGNLMLDGGNYLFKSDKLNNLLLIKLK